MSKNEPDYSSTIIYKINCKDECIKDLYVGHTTNFVQRKYQHKMACNKPYNKCKLYETIRNNGGWENWNMEIVNFFNCIDSCEARKKEQEYFLSLNANLNSVEPFPNSKQKQEKKSIKYKNEYQNHELDTSIDKLFSENLAKYSCDICQIKTNNRKDYKRHLLTVKHIKMVEHGINPVGHYSNDVNKENNIPKKSTIEKDFECLCGRKYMFSSGLYRHRKTCGKIFQHNDEERETKLISYNSSMQQLFLELLKDNKELNQLIINQIAEQSELNKNQLENNKKILECIKSCNTMNNIIE